MLSVLRVFFESGRPVDLRIDGDASTLEILSKRLESIWKKKFSKEELMERQMSARVHSQQLGWVSSLLIVSDIDRT